MDKREFITKLIEELHLTLTRPAMYFGNITLSSAQAYLCGMYSALVLMGIIYTPEIRWASIESQGWKTSSTGAVRDMQEHGLSEEAMVQELLLIEIKMLEMVRDGLAE